MGVPHKKKETDALKTVVIKNKRIILNCAVIWACSGPGVNFIKLGARHKA